MHASHTGQFERSEATPTSQLATIEAELRRCRAEGKRNDVDFRTVAGRMLASKPPSRPLLLNSHFYHGVGTGGVLVTVALVALKRWLASSRQTLAVLGANCGCADNSLLCPEKCHKKPGTLPI